MAQKTILSDVYELLKNEHLVSSESEFSRDWPGMSECYLRALRFKGVTPSAGSVAVCASRLQHYVIRLKHTTTRRAMDHQFLQLSDACHDYESCSNSNLRDQDVGLSCLNLVNAQTGGARWQSGNDQCARLEALVYRFCIF